ncbi:MAG: hypothetical protein KME32_21685 [Mojavia pulchra JT2-VF2]|uniref:Uncharacterized protein n=1 Tax=Mojavia pulchra JT2-VF2 TaxID=287848 RepID=A0A951UIU4_9NOST|nr:hypothetical protein [Mojavia pulchra JT2-VF2]
MQSDAIAAYSTTDGQLLMRSNQLWLPGEVTYSVCDLLQQTLQIHLLYIHQWMGGTPGPSRKSEAKYQINLITGEVTEIYKGDDYAFGLAHDNWHQDNGQVYPLVSGELLLKTNHPRGSYNSAQLHSASVFIDYYYTDDRTQKIVLNVFSNQPPYSKQWEAIIKEFPPEPPRPQYC